MAFVERLASICAWLSRRRRTSPDCPAQMLADESVDLEYAIATAYMDSDEGD
ncbi:hypothetical protein LA76x_5003 [Lysobacter antibioticus]|uniref:Uncharacterized protein n=1 Tax=Lysobacter antibioticus TaxID=84531 RepID=A0A0S2FI06_LYSAN|nr:hypothetical protein LA76x_5003 [Lysobacter antibioticus]